MLHELVSAGSNVQEAPGNPGIGFYLALFLVSLFLSLAGTPLARRLALRTGIVDAPSVRKVHLSPVPLLGGLAIYAAFMLGLLSLSYWFLPFYIPQLAAILLGATVISFFGLWDDKWGLHPLFKLCAQMLVAMWLVVTGVQVEFLHFLPFSNLLNVLATVLWVVTISNAINFIDNMDGLSSGVSAIAAAFFFLAAYQSGQWLVALLSIGLAGAALGFVYHNFGFIKGRTQIFMGDSGSLFLGYLLAALGIKLRFPNTDFVTWMVPVLVLGLPLFDISLVVISRTRRRIPVMRGGKDHTSHRLVALGLTKREAVLVIYLICGMLGVAALVVTGASVADGYWVGGSLALAGLIALYKLEQVPLINTNPKVEGYSKGLKPKRASEAETEPEAGLALSDRVKVE
ncbi:MAG TPA: MraY family glycosyltransferase [Chloroflexia bacterium]|nr:MraY family glycosyltransferase [Chloroflexia bacterium]